MTEIVDPRLPSYVEQAQFELVPEAGAFVFGDGEMQFSVRRPGDVYEVTEVQRGSAEPTWTSSARSAVDRWLVRKLVSSWREGRGLSFPFLPVDLGDVPASVSVQPTGQGFFALTWSEPGRPCRAEGLRRHDAVAVAHLLAWSMDDVLAAVERRNPEPVFSRDLWNEERRHTPRGG